MNEAPEKSHIILTSTKSALQYVKPCFPLAYHEIYMHTIKEVMSTNIISFKKNTSIKDALQALIKNRISGAPVVDNEQIIGVVSEADLLTLFWKKGVKVVEEIMKKDPWSFSQDDKLVEVIDCLMTHNFRRVMIHDEKKRLVGLISRADLMPLILSPILELEHD